MLLIIDNYDSFVFNVVRYCAELGHTGRVLRNDAATLDAIEDFAPTSIIVSPGPCAPADAGMSLAIVAHFSGRVPILGVCLGHQCIGAAFGGKIERASVPMHGRSSDIRHTGQGLFRDVPSPLTVGRYHSLVVAPQPAMLQHVEITAHSPEGEIMALAHRSHPTFGVQFHPESILSHHGHDIFANFFDIAQEWQADAVV